MTVSAQTVWGALRGLETLSQLVDARLQSRQFGFSVNIASIGPRCETRLQPLRCSREEYNFTTDSYAIHEIPFRIQDCKKEPGRAGELESAELPRQVG